MPPKKDKNTEEPLQGSGEAVGAPPSSLASPAPGAGAPTCSRRKAAAAPATSGSGKGKAVDKPAAASAEESDVGAVASKPKAPANDAKPVPGGVAVSDAGGIEDGTDMPGLQTVVMSPNCLETRELK
ncbi:hypothetical protein B0H13DRAFT_2376096 [Mycena leptocephala]|nr:hypothetical protein B0H13DRAFT_2376096 [Mycena leptocephala]